MVSVCQEDGFKNVWVVLMTILNSALLQHFIRTHICKQMCCMQCAMRVLLAVDQNANPAAAPVVSKFADSTLPDNWGCNCVFERERDLFCTVKPS